MHQQRTGGPEQPLPVGTSTRPEQPGGSSWAASWRGQFYRFSAVGVTNALVDVGVFNLLYALAPTRSIPRLMAYNSLAVATALINSYLWNTRWTFRGKVYLKGWRALRQRLLFLGQSLVNVLGNDLVLAVCSPIVLSWHFLPSAVAANVAKLLAMAVSSALTFLVMRMMVFS